MKIEAQFEVGEYETLILSAATVRQGPTEVKGSMQGAEARRLGRRMARCGSGQHRADRCAEARVCAAGGNVTQAQKRERVRPA